MAIGVSSGGGSAEMRGTFPRSEYEERWRRAQDAARERGLAGLVVWSKGGGPVDTVADVLYLANHSSPFPFIADIPGHWSGRAQSAVVLPVDGEPTLIVDLPDWRRDLVAVEDVRFSLDLPAQIAKVLAERGLAESEVGLVVGNAMLVAPYRRLLSAAAGAKFVEADDLVERLRADKSPRELDALREAAAAGNAVVTSMIEAALKPGTTEAEAVAAGYAVAVASGVATYDAAVASGPNSDYYAYGRLPSWTRRTLEEGDFFHVDTYGALDGYLYDFARACVVGGKPSEGQRAVLEAVIDAVHAGVALIRPGVKAGEVYAAVHGVLEERGMTGEASDDALVSALDVSFPAHGHSFGMSWERPWLVPDEEEEIRAGMCFGIEAMAGRPGVGSAKFEQDVIVTEDGTELLTTIPTHYW